jgi:hypothetical protein
MFDNISLQLQNFSRAEYKSFCLAVGREHNEDNNKLKLDWHNLRIEYYPEAGILNIKNSIHKCYNIACNDIIKQAINYNDFTSRDMWQVSHLLSKTFNRPLSDFNLFGKFEYGVNIDTGIIKPYDIINRWQSYTYGAANDFETITPNRGKPFGKTAFLTDYRIKVYDKGKEAELSRVNLFRFEIVLTGVKKLRQLLKLPKVTLQDLNNYETWEVLFNHLLLVYDRIAKLPLWNTPPGIEDLYAIHSYSNKNLNADLKKVMSDAEFQKMRRAHKEVYEKYNNAPGNIHQKIRNKIAEKYPALALPDSDFPPLY